MAADEEASRRRLAELLGFDSAAAREGNPVVIYCLIHPMPAEDKYGRWLVRVELPGGRITNEVLVEEGFAKRRSY